MSFTLLLGLTLPIVLIGILIWYLFTIPPMKEHFIIEELKEKLTVLNPDFAKIDIREGTSTFTEDKKTIYICLRDSNGKYYPMNLLVYVASHELAHLLNHKNYGHTKEFYEIFDKLLCDAAKKGIYDPNIKNPNFYCGIDVRGITMPKCKV